MSYLEQLRKPEWQKKRLKIFERDEWTCTNCGSTHLELHVHHVNYIHSLKPWEYPDSLLKTLCKSCHEDAHGITKAVAEISQFKFILYDGSDKFHHVRDLDIQINKIVEMLRKCEHDDILLGVQILLSKVAERKKLTA